MEKEGGKQHSISPSENPAISKRREGGEGGDILFRSGERKRRSTSRSKKKGPFFCLGKKGGEGEGSSDERRGASLSHLAEKTPTGRKEEPLVEGEERKGASLSARKTRFPLPYRRGEGKTWPEKEGGGKFSVRGRSSLFGGKEKKEKLEAILPTAGKEGSISLENRTLMTEREEKGAGSLPNREKSLFSKGMTAKEKRGGIVVRMKGKKEGGETIFNFAKKSIYFCRH